MEIQHKMPAVFPISTRTLLNVDYYRNLLADDPSSFLDAVKRNDFGQILFDETQHLCFWIERRREIIDEKYYHLLCAETYVAIGKPHCVTDDLRRDIPSSFEDPSAEEQSAWNLSQLDPSQSERRQPFRSVYPCLPPAKSPFEILSDVCLLMKIHARLFSVIEKTPALLADWNLMNPNQLPLLAHHDPILGLYLSPPPDNNSNYLC